MALDRSFSGKAAQETQKVAPAMMNLQSRGNGNVLVILLPNYYSRTGDVKATEKIDFSNKTENAMCTGVRCDGKRYENLCVLK
jgi:hypothetical protein